MEQTFVVTGMTCGSCENKVKNSLLSVDGVKDVIVSKDTSSAIVNFSGNLRVAALQEVLGGKESKYQITEIQAEIERPEQKPSWLATYKPILLIFGYITLIAALLSLQSLSLDVMRFMRIFMAGFFLLFSFFKMLDLRSFADSYSMYDVVAKRWRAWGFIYPFIEFGLGIAFALNLQPIMVNAITLAVMSISVIGVMQSVLNKKKIRCACLGSVFNLPMTTVTIVEDALMILMSGIMLLHLI
ncbi:MAG: heavy-metal-associated domain-containing protein [Pedobacter sp.]|nr:MAG: heavy-metal-associated domain-containing protein [Pedobacter sp.]